MKNKLKKLANDTLEMPQVHQKYTEEDLVNASLIFSHVFADCSFTYCKKMKYTQKQAGLLAVEFGKNIHKTVLLATGIDLHKII